MAWINPAQRQIPVRRTADIGFIDLGLIHEQIAVFYFDSLSLQGNHTF
jgi:hypothetical protein